MRVSVVNEDQLVVVNEQALRFEFNLDNKIHAIQWYGEKGEIEYKDPSVSNEMIEDFSPFQYLVDAFYAKLLQIGEEQLAVEEERILVSDDSPEIAPGNTLWDRIRRERTGRLGVTDWTQLLDSKLTSECIQTFADYRQELRDIPQTYQAPDETLWRNDTIHWPEKPEEVKKI